MQIPKIFDWFGDLLLPSSVLILLIISLFFIGVGFFSAIGQRFDQVAAIVNGEQILKQDYDKIIKSTQDYYKEVYPSITGDTTPKEIFESLPKSTLEALIQEVLLSQKLTEKGINVTDNEARQHLKEAVVDESYGGDWKAYEKELEKNKSNLEIATRNAKRDLMAEKIIEVENLSQDKYDGWYGELRNNANIEIKIDLGTS